MDLSKLSQNDRITLGAAAVVVVTALLSISNDWGALMFLSLAAGAGAIAVILQPIAAPAATLPVARGIALFGFGGLASVATGLSGLNWLGWIIEHLASFDTIQFMTGFAAALVLLYFGYVAFKSERDAAGVQAA